jgi:hypothetical protein
VSDLRNSVKATYDSRETGPRYWVTAAINGKTVAFRERADDPFVRQVVYVGWWDMLRALFRDRRVIVEVTVGADLTLMDDVLELDENTLIEGRTRKAAFGQAMHGKLSAHVGGHDG